MQLSENRGKTKRQCKNQTLIKKEEKDRKTTKQSSLTPRVKLRRRKVVAASAE